MATGVEHTPDDATTTFVVPGNAEAAVERLAEQANHPITSGLRGKVGFNRVAVRLYRGRAGSVCAFDGFFTRDGGRTQLQGRFRVLPGAKVMLGVFGAVTTTFLVLTLDTLRDGAPLGVTGMMAFGAAAGAAYAGVLLNRMRPNAWERRMLLSAIKDGLESHTQ